ncbi:hypothetical protein ABPG77_000663 [Micractinium sp. CCAP 211/92]
MCGSSNSLLQRRSHSHLELSQCGQCTTEGLKSAKSYSDLSEVLKGLPGGLASLRIDERDASQQSGSEDTGRSSPSEHLLRSRSPCAVLYNSQEDAAAPAAGSDAPRCELLPADTPFLESAADFCVLEVPPLAAARATAAAMPAAPVTEQQPPALLHSSGGCSPLPSHAAGDPIVAAAAAAAANGFFSAGVSASSSPHSSAQSTVPSSPQHPQQATVPSGLGLPPRPILTSMRQAQAKQQQAQQQAQDQPDEPERPSEDAVSSPFARLALAEPPSLIQPAPGLLSQASGLSSSRSSLQLMQPPSLLGACGASDLSSSAGSSPSAHSRSGSISAEVALARRNSHEGWGTSTHLSEGHAAEELFYRLNHARQTVDFVKRQATAFSQLNKAVMGVWEALELLNTLREYEAALLGPGDDALLGAAPELPAPDMPLLEHALQCAEACRAAFPDEDFMHLAGLLAPLGKLLAHAKFGAEPQWAICGETFPVGCRFHPSVRHSQFFSANPDRRKRLYSSPTGVYREGCGLGGVLMSWGAGEYLHLVLRLNRAPLPPEALFCIRHLKLRCVFRPGSPYSELLSEFDRVQLPRLAKFQQLCAYRRLPRADPLLVPVPGAEPCVAGEEPRMQVVPHLKQYYDSLLAKYVPQGVLLW